MKKHRKKVYVLLAFVVILTNMFSTTVLATNNNDIQHIKTEDTTSNKVRATVYVELKEEYEKENFLSLYSDKEIKEIEDIFNHKIIYNDDDTVNIINKTIVNPKVFPNGLSIFADGIEIPIEDDGTVLIPKNTEVVSRHIDASNAQKIHSNKNIDNPLLVTKPKTMDEENVEITFSDNVKNVLETMQEKTDAYNKSVKLSNRVETKPYGSKYYAGDDVHCNRFNGMHSDCVHYNWRDPLQLDRALKNFRGSDCQVALSVGSGCPTSGNPFCNGSKGPAWCSSFTIYGESGFRRCPKTFHHHMFDVPSGNWA